MLGGSLREPFDQGDRAPNLVADGLSSVLDGVAVRHHRLSQPHPADDLAEIELTLTSMIWECRLAEPHVAMGVLPDYSPTGAVLYPRV